MKLTKYILSSTLLLSVISGCSKDFLETEPRSSIPEKKAQTTKEGLNGLVNGLHYMTYIYPFEQPYASAQPAFNMFYDISGDDMFNTLPARFMGIYRYQEQTSPDGYLNKIVWDYYYTIIAQANNAIEGARTIEGLPDEEKARLLGEALAYRAWAYHYLVQLFGKRFEPGQANDDMGVILRLGDNKDEPMARATVAETYTQINKDIEEAIENLSKAPESDAKNHIRYATACGIAARIALSQSDWVKAEKYAKLTIDKSGATLQSGDALNDGFNNWNATEWIWGYTQAPDQDLYYSSFFCDFSYNFAGWNQTWRIAVNREIYDKMGSNDVRRKWWVCKDLGDQVPNDAYPGYFEGTDDNPRWEITGQSIKYKARSLNSSRGDILIMRVGEMYYILAEAQYNQGKETEAKATLLSIMDTRDPSYATDHANDLSGQNLLDEIMRNKRIDLWGEGQRFFDLKRQKKTIQRLPSKNIDHLPQVADKQRAQTRNSGASAQKVPSTVDSRYWQYAIPYGEIKGNKLCKQNPL